MSKEKSIQKKSSHLEVARHDLPMVPQNTDQARVFEEVRASIIVAKQFPRNENRAHTEVINACKRPLLAEQAEYKYPRGGTKVSGPSIRLAEVIARHYGNLQYGIRTLSETAESTMFEAFCWDVENNVRATRIFSQKHGRWTKSGGFEKTNDPRDIYEIVANTATRRLRACILEIVPGELVDAAIQQCNATLKGRSDVPLKDRVKSMVLAFNEMGVSESAIEKRLGHNLSALEEMQLVDLGKIYRSLKDGMSKREDWFELDVIDTNKEVDERFKDVKESGTQEEVQE